MWVLFLKLIDDEYQIMQAGYNLVPTHKPTIRLFQQPKK